MKQVKKVNDGIGYARKEPYEWEGTKYEADIQNGDKVKILSEGETTTGQYGDKQTFKIETRNGEKKCDFNQKTPNVLIDAYGDEDKEWVGKELNVILKKDTIGGKKVIIAYIVPDGWKLDDYGELMIGENLDNIEYPEEETKEE